MRGVTFGPNTASALVRLLNQGTPYMENGRTATNAPDVDPLFIRNDSGETIPPYACCKVTGAVFEDNRYIVTVIRPDNTGGPFVFNGSFEIPVTAPVGVAQNTPVVRAKYAVGSPVAGQSWGPVSDWEVTADGHPAVMVYGVLEPSALLKGAMVFDAASCTGLAPGVYQGIAGGPIGPGESGSVTVNGTAYTATNSSECLVRLGERVFVGVDADCNAFFTTCRCCGENGSDACCDRSITFCICGEQKTLKVDGGTASWNVAACCCCSSTATFAISLSCGSSGGGGGGHNITGTWEYSCGATTDSGNLSGFDLNSLCSDDEVELTGDLTIDACDIPLPIRVGNFLAETCVAVPCESEPCESCVGLTDWTTDDPNPSDIGVTAFSMTPDPVCNGDTFTLTFTITNNTGGVWEHTPEFPMYLAYQARPCPDTDDEIEFVSATLSGNDTASAPIYDRSVLWTSGTIANGGTQTYSVTFRLNCCLSPGFSMEIAPSQGRRTSINFACESCP